MSAALKATENEAMPALFPVQPQNTNQTRIFKFELVAQARVLHSKSSNS